jgi:hypothetical protein
MSRTLTVLIALCLSSVALAAEWPHWRGPNHNGTADADGLAAEFGEDRNVRWRVELPGIGEGTPVCANGRIYLPAYRDGDLLGACLDHATGEVLWIAELGKGERDRKERLVSCSPVTNGQNTWFAFSNGDVVCVDADGQEQWRLNLRERYGKFKMLFTYSASPLLVGDRLYIGMMVISGTDYVLCLDAETGETVWRTIRKTDAKGETQDSYASPVPLDLDGVRTGIVTAGGDLVTCHSAEDGKELWRFQYDQGARNNRLVPTVAIENGLLVGVRPRGDGAFVLDVTGPEPKRLWQADGGSPDVASPILHEGLIYIIDDKQKALRCVEARTQEELWSRRLGVRAPIWASPTLADGKVYCMSKRGEFRVVSAGRQGGQALAQVELKERDCLASPAVVGDTVLVRTPKELICVEKR